VVVELEPALGGGPGSVVVVRLGPGAVPDTPVVVVEDRVPPGPVVVVVDEVDDDVEVEVV